MSDEDTPTFTPPHPAIPSRAAHHQTPEQFMEQRPVRPAPMFNDPPLKPKRARKSRKKIAPTKTIIKATPKRKKSVKKIRKARVAKPATPKNPNRPLERKNQFLAALELTRTLQKAELAFFSQAAGAMQNLSRSGRKRAIAALAQVYG